VLASLVSLVVSTLIGAVALKLAVWMVAPTSPNSLLRALLVNFSIGIVAFGASLLGVGLAAATGGIGAIIAVVMIILAPLIVLKAAYGLGTLRAILLVVALAVSHVLLNKLIATVLR